MFADLSSNGLAFAIDVTVKVSLILFCAVGVSRLLGRSAAGVRHVLWGSVLAGVLAIPLLTQVVPGLGLSVLPAADPTPAVVTVKEAATTTVPRPWMVTEIALDETNVNQPVAGTAEGTGKQASRARRIVSQSATSSSVAPPIATEEEIRATVIESGDAEGGRSVKLSVANMAERDRPSMWATAWQRLQGVEWSTWAIGLWCLGFSIVLASLLLGLRRANRIAARSVPIDSGAWGGVVESCARRVGIRRPVRVLITDQVVSPMTWGLTTPRVLLPKTAESWSVERLRVVLLHEFTHVRRCDWVIHNIGRLACAVYWFNPLVWMAAARLSIEREKACDDSVISLGTKPSEYARHLLEIAQSVTSMRAMPVATLSMARHSQLEGRLMGILKSTRRSSRRAMWVVPLLAIAFVVTVAAVEPRRATPPRVPSHDVIFEAPRAPVVLNVDDLKLLGKMGSSYAYVVPDVDVHVAPPAPGVSYIYVSPDESAVPLAAGAPVVAYRLPRVEALPGVTVPEAPDYDVFVDASGACGTAGDHVWYSRGHDSRYNVSVCDDDGSYSYRHDGGGEFTFDKKGRDLELHVSVSGDVEFDDDETDVTEVGRDARVVVRARQDGVRYELDITRGKDGEPAYDWRIDREKAPYDDDAREWTRTMFEIVRDHVRLSRVEGSVNVIRGQINMLRGQRNVVLGQINSSRGQRDLLRGEINRLYGVRNSLLGQENALAGEHNAIEGYINALNGQMNVLGGGFDGMDSRRLQSRLQRLESEYEYLSQLKAHNYARMAAFASSGDDDAARLLEEMNQLVDERLEDVEVAMAEIRDAIEKAGTGAIDDEVRLRLEKELDKYHEAIQAYKVRREELLARREVQEQAIAQQIRDIQNQIESIDIDRYEKVIREQLESANFDEQIERLQREIEELTSDGDLDEIRESLEPRYEKLKELMKQMKK